MHVLMSSLIRIFCIILIGNSYGYAKEDQKLLPDLSFDFECKSEEFKSLSASIERFLLAEKFKVMDVIRFRHEQGLAPMQFDVFIDATDTNRRMIRFISLSKGVYSADLLTPPPTQRSNNLEDALVYFVSNILKCRVGKIVRNENGQERRKFYDQLFDHLQKRLRLQEL